nr:ribonuclease H-like domain-containing protein [Tanacetum cinerariifolium]
TAFVSATSTNKKLSYGDSPNHFSTTTYSVPSNSKTRSHKTGNVIEDVLQSFVANIELEQQLAYKDLEQIEKLDLEEMDLKWQRAMLSVRVHKFEQKAGRKIDFDKKESARKEEDSKALVSVDTLVDLSNPNHENKSDEVIASKEFGMITGANSEEAYTPDDAGEFALMGVTFERNSSKNLYRLIDSSMSVRTKVGLGFTDYISQNELGWDDFAFSVFTTTSEDVEGRPTFHKFAKTDSMKVVPPPLTGDYTSLSDHSDLDESQIDKFSEYKPTDYTSCASTSSVSTSVKPVPTGTPKVKPVPTGKPKVKPVSTGQLEVTPVLTGTPQVFTPVPTGIDRKLLLSPQQVILGNHIVKVYNGYPRTIVDLIHLHTDDNVADLLTKAFDGPRFNNLVVNIGMLNP